MKYLIGMTGVNTPGAHTALGIIRDELNLLHSNIRQPVIDAMAGLLNTSSHRVEHHIEPHRYFPPCRLTAGELDKRFADVLTSTNPNFLIEETQARMGVMNELFGKVFFNGHIVSGITTADEMQWIRKQGGILIHIAPAHIETKDIKHWQSSDAVITSSNAAPPTRRCLKTLLSFLHKTPRLNVH